MAEPKRAFDLRMGEAIAELVVQGKADHSERLAIAASRTIGDSTLLLQRRDLFHAQLVL